jgi:hypothetical protein
MTTNLSSERQAEYRPLKIFAIVITLSALTGLAVFTGWVVAMVVIPIGG